MMAATLRLLGVLALAALSGCGGGPQPMPAESGAAAHLRQIANAYDSVVMRGGRPPRSMEDLRPVLQAMVPGKDPDEYFRSPNDGEPYVIVWGIRLDRIDDADGVLAHEKKGRDGKRFVITLSRFTKELSDAEFSQIHYPRPSGPVGDD
jgi:hypothetical protein